MLHRLAPVRVCDQLGPDARGRPAVRVIDVVRGRVAAAHGGRLGRGVPLRHAGGELDEIVLLARSVPLGYPTAGERWRWEGRAIAAGRGRAGHCHEGFDALEAFAWVFGLRFLRRVGWIEWDEKKKGKKEQG